MVSFRSLLALSIALAACGSETTKPATALILVADTDIASIDRIRFEIRQTGKSAKEVTAKLGDEPLYLTVVHGSGSLGPLEVSATGLDGETEVLTRDAVVQFESEKTLTVPLHLSERCVAPNAPDCSATQTCTESGCQPRTLTDLTPWTGAPPSLQGGGEEHDGGPSEDAGPRADGGPTDGGANGDAGAPVCTADTDNDPLNCGDCGNVCAKGHATSATCVQGQCRYKCSPKWENCNQDTNPFDGCETRTTSPAACGCGDGC